MQRRTLLITPFAAGLAGCGGGGSSDGGPVLPPIANLAVITGQLTTRQPGLSVPVAGATVFMQASDRLFETSTDELGNYRLEVDASAFRNPAPFVFNVCAYKAGFMPLTINYPRAPIVAGVTYGPPAGLDVTAFWMSPLPADAYSSLAFARGAHLGRDVVLETEGFLTMKTQGDSWSAVVFDWVSANNGRLRHAQLFISLLGVDGVTNITKGSLWLADADLTVLGSKIALDFTAYPGARYPSFWSVPLPASLPAGPVRVFVTTGTDASGPDAMEVWGRYIVLRSTAP